MNDISQGLERMPVPCKHTTVLEDISSCQFRYVTRSVPGPGCSLKDFNEQFVGCRCQTTCDVTWCECLQRFGEHYEKKTKKLLPHIVTDAYLKPVVECNNNCRCDSSCSNRLVQHGPFVRLEVQKLDEKGYGLFTLENIPLRTFVCEYAGEVVGIAEALKRLKEVQDSMNYLIVLREHCATGVNLTCVDPRHLGNMGRFLNHSCDPNLVMVPVRVDNSVPRLALFACRNILAGEELTFDYSGETLLYDGLSGSECLSSSGTSDAVARKTCKEHLSARHNEETILINGGSHWWSKEKLPNSRKRKIVDGKGHVNDGLHLGQDRHSNEDSAGDLATRFEVPSLRKICLCGSSLCKGYLPFSETMFI